MRLAALALLLALLVPAAHAKLPPPPTETAVVPTGKAPCGLAVTGDSLLVGVYETGQLLRLDRSGRIAGRARVGRFACQVAVAGGATWVTRDNANEVVRVDAGGRIRRIAVSSPHDLAVAAGSVWVASFETGTVTRLGLTGRRRGVLEVGGHPTGVAACGGRVWVGHGRDATWVTAIEPRTGRARRVDVGVPTPRWPRCVRGELWVTTESSALRLDPRTGAPRGRFELGDTLAEAGAGAPGRSAGVWITDKEHSRVHRLDPVAGQVVDSFPAGPGALALEHFAGSVWVTSFAGSDVRRFDAR
jgi:streptogramin lyase